MQRFLTLLLAGFVMLAAYAAKKPQQAIVNLISYDKSGEVLASGYGFFISQDGRVVVPYQLLEKAVRAEVIDTKGKRYEVARVVGANSNYDLAVLTITAAKPKFEYFEIAADSVAAGAKLTVYPYSAKKAKSLTIKVDSVAAYDTLCYYTTTVPNEQRFVGCPLLNEAGQVVAIVQQSASAENVKTFAIDARFVPTLRTTAMSSFSADLRRIRIPKLLPEGEQNAQSYILMLDAADSLCTAVAHADFMAAYPASAEGYLNYAQFNMLYADYENCEQSVAKAFEVAQRPDEVHYAFSKMLYQMARSGVEYKDWTAHKSAAEAAAAYAVNPLPLYRMQEAHSYFLAGDFTAALPCFDDICATELVSPEAHYMVSKCLLLTGADTVQAIARLDSAINTLVRPIQRSQAYYVLERANLYSEIGEFRKAVLDYNQYEGIMTPRALTDRFYALRAQVELAARMYQQALDDLQHDAALSPNNAYYPQEQARVLLIVGYYDDAIAKAQVALDMVPQNPEAYKLMGIAYRQKGDKQQAQQCFSKAKELGDNSVDEYLK
ncbi:MAG: hypothetical protein II200_04055 [Bacteroidaceae bacterium]|nr:hypothetical protein [Bacteroidaceae bacterium]